MRFVYFEKKWLQIVYIAFIQALLAVGIFWELASTRLIQAILSVGIFVLFIFQVFVLIKQRRVLEFNEELIFIRGLIPGLKPLQRWHEVGIKMENILTIRIGKIREKAGGFNVPPLNDPTSASAHRSYLWITYKENEAEKEIYYPHTPQIKNFEGASKKLQEMLKDKVVIFE